MSPAIRGRREALLLDVEDEVAAPAQAVEILAARHPREQRVVRPGEDRGAAGADAGGRGREARRRDELARADDVPARDLAVEPDAHHAAGAQQRAEDPPAGDRILEVMQHAGAIDDVEALGSAPSARMSACRYSMLPIPSSRVLRTA